MQPACNSLTAGRTGQGARFAGAVRMNRLALLAACAAATVLHGSFPLGAAEHLAVRLVFDGDTIDVSGRGRVRLLGIDAPEIGAAFDTPQPFADEARAHLASLVLHRYVHLETDGEPRDAYGRLLAYVIRDDGLLANAEMLRAGFATVSARQPLRRLGELRRAETSAQQSRRGVWGGRPVLPRRRAMFPLNASSDRALQLRAP